MEFATLRPLIWLLAMAGLILIFRYSVLDRPPVWKYASQACRSAAILLLILALCRPFLITQSSDLHVMFLVDVSQSVEQDDLSAAVDQIDVWVKRLRPGDVWNLMAVGNGVRRFESTDNLRQAIQAWQAGGGADDEFRSATKLGSALLASRASFAADKARRVVVVSDGQETESNLSDALRQLAQGGIDVQWWPIPGKQRAEAAVMSFEPSARDVHFGARNRMRVELAANQDMHANLRIVHQGVVVQSRFVTLAPHQRTVVDMDVALTSSGAGVWSAELVADRDHWTVNNRLSTTVNVRGRPRILTVHRDPRAMRSFAQAMMAQDIEMEVRDEQGLPTSLEELAAFDAVLLADVSATALSAQQMQLLRQYVVDAGGGIAMFGSENSFGLGGFHGTPVEEVLPVVSRFEKNTDQPSLAMVLVIDKSGSMKGPRIELARNAAKGAVELMRPSDSIAVIGFDSEPQVVCEMTKAADVAVVQHAIESLTAGGGTFLYPAMAAGKEMLEATPAQIRHMVCLSDGQTEPGDYEHLTEEMVQSGLTVSTVVLGDGDKELMSAIAEIGHGRYYETNDPTHVPQIFSKETIEAAASAIKEDVFTVVPTSDQPVLAGYESVEFPATLGYVMTEIKPTAQMLLAVENGDPLLAIGQYGLGKGLAFTSDLTERWGSEWLAWEGCGRFWAQMFRSTLRRSVSQGIAIDGHTANDAWHFDIRRTDEAGLPVNGVTWDAQAMDGGPMAAVTVQEIGLGRYAARVSHANRDRLALRLHDTERDTVHVVYANRSYPREYHVPLALPPELASIPKALPQTVTEDVQPIRTRKSAILYCYWGAMVGALASILLRRI